jgi:hypothetical protein
MAVPTRHGTIPPAPISAEDKVCLASTLAPDYRLQLNAEEPNHFNAFIFYCFNPKNEFCCTPQGTLEAGVTGRNTSCCDDEDLVFKAKEPFVAGTAAAVLPRVTTSSLSSSTSSSSTSNLLDSTIGSTSTAAAVTTSSSSTSTPTASSESSGMSSGAKAGLGVGIALGFLAILAIIGAVFLRRRKANNHNGAVLLSDSKSDPPPYVTYESAGTARAELDGTMLPAEMRDSSNKISSSNPVAREMGTTTPTKEDIAVQRYT